MTPTPIILDCDPGHDDALAILLALAAPEIRLLAITTVAGNAALENTTRNALRVLALAGRSDVPVAAGADRSLAGAQHTAPQVHGASGLEGADLPEPVSEPVAADAVSLIRQLIDEPRDPLTLVPTGPLTNIATLIQRHPETLARVKRICLMGGSMAEGNWTASAEFNIWADPEAAAIVFSCGRPIVMMGLDVTHSARLTGREIEEMAALDSRTGRVFADLTRYFARFHAERYGWDGPPIHDAVAVAHLIDPSLVTTRPYPVAVETEGQLTRGRTVVDSRPHTPERPNVDVGVAIDRERFAKLLLGAIGTFP